MDDSQQPSYYEIALTSRQVLVFFVVLLVCVVGAFFSGIWLGQQRSGDTPRLAEVAPIEAPSEEGTETLAELNFFTDDESSPAKSGSTTAAPPSAAPKRTKSRPETGARPESVAPDGSPETTLLEDVNGSEPVAPPPKRPPAIETLPAEAAPARTASEPVQSQSGGAGGFVIQVFSSPDGAQARKLLDRLTSGGYEAFISPVDVSGRTMHRVRVGPFDDKAEAETVATRVETDYQIDTWVTANDQ